MITIIIKIKIHSLQLWDRRFRRNSSLQAVCDTPIALYELCVLIKDIGRRLPLQLQCSYQGQQDDFRQSVRGNYKTRFWGGQNLTAVKGNVSFYQVNLVSRTTGEGGGAEFWRTWGPGFDQKHLLSYPNMRTSSPISHHHHARNMTSKAHNFATHPTLLFAR